MSLLGNRLVACATLCAALSGPGRAETIQIRSGEHHGFTRIALDGLAARDWRLGRSSIGYSLHLDGASVNYDTSRVFRAIRRDRIAGLVALENGTLRLRLGCECHAKAFATDSGTLVIDIADGAAPPDSPFEMPIPLMPPVTPEPPRLSPHPDIAETGRDENWQSPHDNFRRQAISDTNLAFFWRGVIAEPPVNQVPSDHRSKERVPAGHSAGQRDDTPRESEPPLAVVADPFSTPGPLPTIPDPRLDAARSDLLHQLGRAASQGLLEIDGNRIKLPSHGGMANEQVRDRSAPDSDLAPPGPAITPLIHAETSVDRDSVLVSSRPPVTADGVACIDSEELTLTGWGDERPLAIQIAERREGLVGEFDRPVEAAILALSRLYIHLGFGAEARAVLRAFDLNSQEARMLSELGQIVDGYYPGPESVFVGMADCDSSAALWAILALPELPRDTRIDQSAVLRAFSALPPHLRRVFGSELSERLLMLGAGSAARSVRDAIARSPTDAQPVLSLIDAQLGIARGESQDAELKVDALARSNDPLAAEALVLSIQSRLDRGEAVDPALTASIGALAFERQDGPQGPILNRLHILSLGSAGNLAKAFQAFHRWPGQPSPEIRNTTALDLFSLLANDLDEAGFLKVYFSQKTLLDSLDPDTGVRLALAERLMTSGFSGEVRNLLTTSGDLPERGYVLLAQAALAEFDPVAALTELEDLTGETAERLRAQALTMAGDHLGAARAYAQSGDTGSAGRAAWRSGDWATVEKNGPDPMRQTVADLDLAVRANSPAETDVEPGGELARGRVLLGDSRAVRATLDNLLALTQDRG